MRVHWMLHELGLSYETIKLDISAGENRKPEYLAINPAGQVPAMVIDGLNLAESVAIVQFLADKFKPELAGRTPEERAQSLQWGLWTMLNPQKAMLDLAMMVWRNAADEAKTKTAHETLEKELPILEALLSTRAFVAGDPFTTGDLIACVSLTYASFSKFDLSTYSNITRWMGACTSRPAYIAATSQK